MFSPVLLELNNQMSTIRQMSDLGKRIASEYGSDQVYDFTLGNPSIPAPDSVNDSIRDIIDNQPSVAVHGYTDYKGIPEVRQAIADQLNEQSIYKYGQNNIYITTGASAALNMVFRSLSDVDSKFMLFAPFFPEYKYQVEGVGSEYVIVPADTEKFQLNFEEMEKRMCPEIMGVVIDSPCNPTGVLLSENTILRLASILKKYEQLYGHPIYLISDEPYREVIFDGKKVPFVPNYYKNTIIVYSYSKSLSLPGERIGYIALSSASYEPDLLFRTLASASRVAGYVNAPSLFQQVILRCIHDTSDISIYQRNRDVLYPALTEMGYNVFKPEGTFYMFIQSPIPDAKQFCMYAARTYHIMLVPSDDFECKGYFRLSFCVNPEVIERSLPLFKKLWEDFQ